MIQYTAMGTVQDLNSLRLDQRYTVANIAFLRSSWDDPAAVYVGFKGGDNTVNHAHLRVLRGVRLLNNRSQVLVQDEIEADPAVDITWAMHTRANVSVSGLRATLRQVDQDLQLRVLEPEDPVLRVEGVNLAPPQEPTQGVRKLVLQMPSSRHWRVSPSGSRPAAWVLRFS